MKLRAKLFMLVRMNALSALFLTLLWSTTPLAIKWSVTGMPFSLAVTARFSLAALVVWLVVQLRRHASFSSLALWRSGLIAGVASAASMLCTYWASQHVTSGLVAVLFGLTPLMTALFAWLWLDERLRIGELCAITFGLAGLAAIFADHLHSGPQGWFGIVVILLAVALQSAGAVLLKRHTEGQSASAINTCALLICATITGCIWLWSGAPQPEHRPDPRALAAILYLAIIGSALGFSVYYKLIQTCRPISVALISLLTPACALWLGHAVNHEAVSGRLAIGSALILAGLGLHLLNQHQPTALPANK